MEENLKNWIDTASYEQLLSHWRFAPVGDPLFQGETGDYYSKVMARKREEVGHNKAVEASKNIEWEK
jgi:hypothetical protein